MPRKSDASRRSDVSMARSALAEGEAATTAPEPSAAPVADTTQPQDFTPAAPVANTGEASQEVEMERASESAAPSDKRDRGDTVAIEDLNLPKSIITRLAKGVLPPNTQIQANAILAMTKAATVFINHLADSANRRTMDSNKKTIMPNDVFEALEDIEYPEFRDIVQKEFKKFNEVQSTKRNTYRRKVAAAKKGVPYVEVPGLLREPRVPEATGPPGTTFIEDPAAAAGIDTSRSIKKQRMSSTHPANGGSGSGSTNDTNGAANNPDDSAMTGVDADTTQEYQDAESEPDEPIDEDDEEPEDDVEEEEDDEEEDDEEGEGADDDEMHDALEERENGEDEDEALDNGEDSDS